MFIFEKNPKNFKKPVEITLFDGISLLRVMGYWECIVVYWECSGLLGMWLFIEKMVVYWECIFVL